MNRKLLTAALSGALALPMAAQGVDIAASGHVNRALVFSGLTGADDPKHTDGSASGSRFRFTGSQDLENGVTAGVTLEYGVGNAAADGSWNPGVRHASVDLSGAFGKMTLGQTAPATHLIGYANFDNFAWLSGTEIGCDFCAASGMASSVFTSFGPGRMEVIRFETRDLGPAKLSFSANGNNFWDAALRVAGDTNAFSYQLNVGYTTYPAGSATAPTNVFLATPFPVNLTDAMVKAALGRTHSLDTTWYDKETHERIDTDTTPSNDDDHYIGRQSVYRTSPDGSISLVKRHYLSHDSSHRLYTSGAPATPASNATTVSAAIAFAQGTHFNITFGRKEPDTGANSEFTHVGIGHNVGDTSVAATYTVSDVGGGGTSWAVGVGHNLAGVELYAGYKILDHDSALVDDYGIAVIGSRIKFN
jgi:predicted porin